MNRHVKIALVMAPILALVSYGITGYFQPKQEQKPGDYRLRLTSECMPTANSCEMKSGEFKVMLISSIKKGKKQLALVANQPMSYLSLALAQDNGDFEQFRMMKSDDSKYWQIGLNDDQVIDEYTQYRFAAKSLNSNYYIETDMKL